MTESTPRPAAEVPTYKLSLKGKGVTVEQDVPVDVARNIIALVMGGIASDQGSRAAAPAPGSRLATGVSVREFIDEAGAKKNPQIVTAIGMYLIDHEGQERFTRPEVKARFAQAGEPTPANVGRDFSLAVTSGWIAENPRNEFYVTDSGRRAIEAMFEGQKIRRPRRRAAKKPTAAKAKES